MDDSSLVDAIVELCTKRQLTVELDKRVGNYMAPILIQGHDDAGVQRDVRITVEPRNWSNQVAQRMSQHVEMQIDRLRNLSEVDFVAIVIGGTEVAPGKITSLGELDDFLSGFSPPKTVPEPAEMEPMVFLGPPTATKAYESDIAGQFGGWTGGGIVFCAMPFASEFDNVFFDLIAPAVVEANLAVLRTDQEETLAAIDKRIRDGIQKADLVVADITGHNPNVMYEVGVSHALEKQTLLIRSDDLPMPFDIRYHELMDYTDGLLEGSRKALSERLAKAANALWG